MNLSSVAERFLSETIRLFLEISTYLILGFFFAGLLHALLGEKYIRKHFAKSGLWSTIKAAIFGIPLPVCSCAVIPLAESLRKDGASKSATMSFLVSTPSSGVDSILATYALMGPVYAVFRPIASFLSGIFVGIVTHIKGEKEKPAANITVAVSNGKKKKKSVKEVFIYGFRVLPGEIARWLIIGVIIGGAISALVPDDFGIKYLGGSTFLNYAVILLISIPLYVCATGSIPIAASLIAKGVLPGAALALLIAGPATNSVTISFVFKRMGKKIAFLYVASIILVSVLAGLVFDALWNNIDSGLDLVAIGGAQLPQSIKITAAIFMMLIFINAKYNLGKIFKSKKKVIPEDNNRYTIKIPDMTCQHCQMKITGALEEMPGISSISIDLNSRELAVESSLERREIIHRIQQEGYRPQ